MRAKKAAFCRYLAKEIHLARMPQFDLTNAHKEIGKQLRQLRIATGKTINEAAVDAGIAPGTLSKIEDGESNFRVLTLGKLCKGYNTDLSQLLKNFTLSPPAAKQDQNSQYKRKGT